MPTKGLFIFRGSENQDDLKPEKENDMEKCFELKKELQERLEELCLITRKSPEESVQEAVEMYLGDMEDILIASRRDKDEKDELIGIDEMRRRLGLEN